MKTELSAPEAEKIDTVLTVHGDSRVDPYYWMRLTDQQKTAANPDAQTEKVLDYLKEENEYKEGVLEHTKSLQEKIYQEIIGRIKQDDESVPYFKNGYWYYTRYQQDKEYPVYCRKLKTLEGEEQIMLDVNELAAEFDYYQVSSLEVSPDNKILSFAEDTLSRRIYTIKFKNLETGVILPDQLFNAAPGAAWASDNKTFFYTTKNQATLLEDKIWRHKLGQQQNQDDLVHQESDNTFYSGVYSSKSNDYIIIYNVSTLTSDYHILKADDPDGEFKQFTARVRPHEYKIEHYGDKFYILTNWEATNFRLMETPVSATDRSNWKEVIAHRENTLLDEIEVFRDFLVVQERSDALIQIGVIEQQTGNEHYMDFDESAYVVYPSTNVEFDTEVLRYGYSSLTTPNSIYDYNMRTREQVLMKQQEVVGGHRPEDYQTERIYAVVRDGTRVPISLVYKKGMIKNQEPAPTLLFSYGSYGLSMDPWFNSSRLSLLDRGFIFAIAHIRGGQEMGRQWYEDGKLLNKKNTFYDFIDCAQFLIKENYTTADHLYAMGGSAGGLLMGAAVNMAPETFNGVIAAVPWVDVVTTMLDESIPLTTNEFDEWGNPKNKEYYDYMLSYSPYDQVRAQSYPNMLVTTGLFDSQVQYWEPAKWVAKLRDMKTDDNLLLLDTDMDTGHGGSSGRFKRHKRTALEYAFLLDLEGIKE
jgi:oligopeptidase B